MTKWAVRPDTPKSVRELCVRVREISSTTASFCRACRCGCTCRYFLPLLDQGLPERSRGESREVATSIQKFLEEFRSALGRADQAVPAGDLLKMMLRSLSSETLTPNPEDTSVEIVGWMESAFDPASLRIVVGMNETMIPQLPSPEPLLPDSLRQQCGLSCQRTRTARCVVDVVARIVSVYGKSGALRRGSGVLPRRPFVAEPTVAPRPAGNSRSPAEAAVRRP